MGAEAKGSWAWEDMIGAFRALGGVVENVRPGIGPHGRGLFVIDPERDVRIRLPQHLLIDVDDVVIEGGRLTIRREAGIEASVRSFFERFEASFSFGAGAADEGRDILGALHALPDEIQEHLLADEPSQARRFPAPTDELVLRWFKDTRSAMWTPAPEGPAPGKTARRVLIPLLDLVNHSSAHPAFRPVDGALEVSGRFADEVFFRYSTKDTWQKFALWGFVSDEPLAYSIPLGIGEPGGPILHIRRNIGDFEDIAGFAGPKVERRGDVLALSHLVLGHRKMPGLPRWLFHRAMATHDVAEPDELFDAIAEVNRLWFRRLLELLENHQNPMCARMRTAARLQLETLSFSMGPGQTPALYELQLPAATGTTT
jgi:hypothetical protein